MFGLGYRTTSYAFAIAAGFLVLAGEEYHKFAFASIVAALVVAYLKINEAETDRRTDYANRRVDDLDDVMHRQITELQEKITDRK
jgi:hypothetical protein